jgi:hypothetical protein
MEGGRTITERSGLSAIRKVIIYIGVYGCLGATRGIPPFFTFFHFGAAAKRSERPKCR